MNKILLFLLVFVCTSGAVAQNKSQPFVLGVVDTLSSSVLNEKRILNIYLPDDYSPDKSGGYPVIYLLDGGADEDFIHVAGLVQFNTFSWINTIPKSIVVGIANVDRRRDFTFPSSIENDSKMAPTSGGAEKFITFIEKELQPYIQNKYKANDTGTLIGQSLGGLLATEILFNKPQLFTKYIIVSPSLWWNNGSLLEKDISQLDKNIKGTVDVYIAVGKEGLTPAAQPRVMEVDANVLAEKIKDAGSKKIKVYFDYLPDENHATISHQAIFNAFRKIYK
jgi:uncharacterized protein